MLYVIYWKYTQLYSLGSSQQLSASTQLTWQEREYGVVMDGMPEEPVGPEGQVSVH